MHADGNITGSIVKKLHISESPAWIVENVMFCKCLGESSLRDSKLLLCWEGPELMITAQIVGWRPYSEHHVINVMMNVCRRLMNKDFKLTLLSKMSYEEL